MRAVHWGSLPKSEQVAISAFAIRRQAMAHWGHSVHRVSDQRFGGTERDLCWSSAGSRSEAAHVRAA